MKKILYALFIVSVLGFNASKTEDSNEIDIEKYFKLEYGSFEKNGEIKHRVTPQIIEKQDSIGKIITQRKRRIMYLRINRINADTLNNLLPDSIAIKKIFLQELNKPDFKSNFLKIIYPNQQEKQMFTEEEMMTIASKFFLVEKKD